MDAVFRQPSPRCRDGAPTTHQALAAAAGMGDREQ